MSRLTSRIEALKHRRRRPEPYTALKLLTTEDLLRALVLVERGGVLPNGEARNPEVYQEASHIELEALERWAELCGEPLDHLEAAEELLDRMGDAHGWGSPDARDAALLRERLELPGASPWLIEKTAEAVVRFYAELEEYGDQPRHPALRGAVRRLERLQEIVDAEGERGEPVHDTRGGRPVDGPVRARILVCEECGERTVLDGPLSAWAWGSTSFGCECGERVTLADGLDRKGFGGAGGATNAASPT